MQNMHRFSENIRDGAGAMLDGTADQNSQRLSVIRVRAGHSEMKPMDTDCRTKCTVRALLTQPYGAPGQICSGKCKYAPKGNLMFENNSPLASVSCQTSCFALWLLKL